LLRGEVRFDNSLVDDQVLMKTDGFPTYHLANVVDDHEMKITHVIRAEEWLVSTPKHEALYNAFGWQIPTWVHMPLLRNPDKSKISKRKNPVSLDYYRDAGYLPEALLNFLGTMGWSISGDREKFDLEEMIRVFTFDRVSLGGPVFDLVKLRVLNSIYLRELDDQQFVDRLRTWRFSDEYLRSLVPLVRQRVELLSDFIGKTDFFFQGDVDHAAMGAALVPKKRTRVETIEVLKAITEWLDQQRDFSAHGLETDAKIFAEKVGWEPKEVSMLLRVGATARKATPPLFETLEALGRDLVRKRIRECTEVLKRMPDAPVSA
jgi:glutamyl-tRNA synthetase